MASNQDKDSDITGPKVEPVDDTSMTDVPQGEKTDRSAPENGKSEGNQSSSGTDPSQNSFGGNGGAPGADGGNNQPPFAINSNQNPGDQNSVPPNANGGNNQPPSGMNSNQNPGGQNGVPPNVNGGNNQPPFSMGSNQNPPAKNDAATGTNGQNNPPSGIGNSTNFMDMLSGNRNKRMRPESTPMDGGAPPLFKAENRGFTYEPPAMINPGVHTDLVDNNGADNMETLAWTRAFGFGNDACYISRFGVPRPPDADGKPQLPAYIYRIQLAKDSTFVAIGKPLSKKKSETEHNDYKWNDVRDVLGVAIVGPENRPDEVLAKIDPKNPYFERQASIFIHILWWNFQTSFVSRAWWRKHYKPADKTNAERKEKFYFLKEKKEDGDIITEWVENENGFKDKRLFNWAFQREKEYWELKNPGIDFHHGREKSATPVDDDIAKFREMSMPPDMGRSGSLAPEQQWQPYQTPPMEQRQQDQSPAPPQLQRHQSTPLQHHATPTPQPRQHQSQPPQLQRYQSPPLQYYATPTPQPRQHQSQQWQNYPTPAPDASQQYSQSIPNKLLQGILDQLGVIGNRLAVLESNQGIQF